MRGYTAFYTFMAQPVAFLHPQRQKQIRRRAVALQHLRQQRERRHSVHVVITEKNDALAAIDRFKNSLDGGGHIRQPERIAQ